MSQTDIICSLRSRRGAAGLSQQELADRVGVSRQAIVAIEGGRQVPSTTLALQVARALRCDVEDLFALPRGPLLQATIARGQAPRSRVAVGRVDGAWVAHALHDPDRASDGLVAGDTTDGEVMVEPLVDPALLQNNALVAGCAPLLGLLAARLDRRQRDVRATWLPSNSTRSLQWLEQGLVHIAGLHLVETDTPGGHTAIVTERFPDHETTIVNLTCWRQGIIVAPGNPLGIRGPEDLLRDDVRFARREDGSGAQRLAVRLLADVGADEAAWADGPVAVSHADVARLVRWGVADAGIGIEAAALELDLAFLPLAEERFDLLVPRRHLEVAPVRQLLDLLENHSFRAEAERLRGYDLSTTGHASTVCGSQR